MPAILPATPGEGFEDEIAEMEAAEVPASEMPYVEKVQSLFQLSRSFEFFADDYSYRIRAVVRLFSRMLASSNADLVSDARRRAKEYFDVTNALVEALDSPDCVGEKRQLKEEQLLADLLDRNKQVYAAYANVFGRSAAESVQDRNYKSGLFRRLRRVIGVITERYWGQSHVPTQDQQIIDRSRDLLQHVDFAAIDSPEEIGLAEVSVYLGGSADEADLRVVESRLIQFGEVLSIQYLVPVETVRGSIFKRFIGFFRKTSTTEEIAALYEEAKDALRAQQLNKPRSETISNLATAASALLGALENHDNAILRLGEVVVVKYTHDGITNVGIETISAELVPLPVEEFRFFHNGER